MGVGRSVLRRAVQAPIVEKRGNLEKVLENAPKLAPKHESTKELLEKSKTDNQASFHRHNKKNEKYLNLLKSIHVDTIDLKETEQQKDVPSEASYKQTGSLKSEQLVLLFQQRMTNPEEWNEQKIATFFQLPPESVKNLLKYYSDFNVQTAPQLPEPLEDITV